MKMQMQQSSNAKSSNGKTVAKSSNANFWNRIRTSKNANAKSSNEDLGTISNDVNSIVIGQENISNAKSSNTNDESYNANEYEAGYNDALSDANRKEQSSNANEKSSNRLATWFWWLVTGFEWVVTFRWIVVIARWLVATGGNIAESAFLVSTVWVTVEIMAPVLVKWMVPDNIAALANQLAVIAFTVLPELIIWTALITCYEHWKLSWRSNRLDERLWAIAYSIPTAAFLGMTIITLTSFVSLQALGEGAPQATGWWLVIRCMAGWIYGTVSILYSKGGGGKRLATIMENQSANIKELVAKMKAYDANLLALKKDKLELQEMLNANQKELVDARLQLASGKVLSPSQKQDAITMLEVANRIAGSNANDVDANDYNANRIAGSNAKSSNANGEVQSSNANANGSNVSSSNYNVPANASISIPVTGSSNSIANGSNGKRVTTLKSSNANARNTDAIPTQNANVAKSSNARSANYIKLKEAISKNIQQNTKKNFKTIAAEIGVGYSTANLYKQEIYAELAKENANA